MRCIALAEALKARGWHCTFVVAERGVETVRRLAPGYEVLALPEAAALDPAGLMRASPGCDLLIVDHYGWWAAQEHACRAWARRILVIDDLCDRAHDCDLLLDVSLGRTRADYAVHVAPACQVLTGPGYALLRPQFARQRLSAQRPPAKAVVERVFVSFGLSDASNFSQHALEALRAVPFDGKVDLVLGRDAPHLAQVQAEVRRGQVKLHQEPDHMASLMAAADFAIGAGGGSAWERCCLGLPSLVISAAPNQDRNARTLAARGACELAQDGDFAVVLARLLRDPQRLAQMALSAAAVTDGRGAPRVALALDPELTPKGGVVTLRRLTLDDFEPTYEWQCHPETRQHARNPAVPSREEHRAWIARELADPGSVANIIEHDGALAGVVRLNRKADAKACEVSINVAPELHGRGIATAALAALRRLAPEVAFMAHVLADNATSHALFIKAGYTLDGDVYVSRPSADPH